MWFKTTCFKSKGNVETIVYTRDEIGKLLEGMDINIVTVWAWGEQHGGQSILMTVPIWKRYVGSWAD